MFANYALPERYKHAPIDNVQVGSNQMALFRPRDRSLAYRWPRRRGLCYAARQAGGEVLRNVAQCGSGGKTCPLVLLCNHL
jgi:hypothetical protein